MAPKGVQSLRASHSPRNRSRGHVAEGADEVAGFGKALRARGSPSRFVRRCRSRSDRTSRARNRRPKPTRGRPASRLLGFTSRVKHSLRVVRSGGHRPPVGRSGRTALEYPSLTGQAKTRLVPVVFTAAVLTVAPVAVQRELTGEQVVREGRGARWVVVPRAVQARGAGGLRTEHGPGRDRRCTASRRSESRRPARPPNTGTMLVWCTPVTNMTESDSTRARRPAAMKVSAPAQPGDVAAFCVHDLRCGTGRVFRRYSMNRTSWPCRRRPLSQSGFYRSPRRIAIDPKLARDGEQDPPLPRRLPKIVRLGQVSY